MGLAKGMRCSRGGVKSRDRKTQAHGRSKAFVQSDSLSTFGKGPTRSLSQPKPCRHCSDDTCIMHASLKDPHGPPDARERAHAGHGEPESQPPGIYLVLGDFRGSFQPEKA